APDEHTQVRYVVPAGHTTAATDVGGVEVLVEGGAGEGCAVQVPHVGQAANAGAGARPDQSLRLLQAKARVLVGHRKTDGRVQQVPGACEPSEELHYPRAPAGDVGGQLLQERHGSLAAPVVDGLGHVQPLVGRIHVGHQVRGQQVTQVGDDPVVAGLD